MQKDHVTLSTVTYIKLPLLCHLEDEVEQEKEEMRCCF